MALVNIPGMKIFPLPIAAVMLSLIGHGAAHGAQGYLVKEERFTGTTGYILEGNAKRVDVTKTDEETAGHAIALDSAPGGAGSGRVEIEVHGIQADAGFWFRFSISGLPEKSFAVKGEDDLFLQVKFSGKDKEALDGVVKEIYADVAADRKDIEKNGDNFRNGASAWPRRTFDFKLPFADIDTLKLSVAFRNPSASATNSAAFLVDDMRLERIALPAPAAAAEAVDLATETRDRLAPLGGKWFYFAREGENLSAPPRRFDSTNLDRLVYKTGSVLETPFAMNRGTWLRKGFKDERGDIVEADRWKDDPVTVEFTDSALVIHTADLPNHPTGSFPGYLRNPNFIQEKRLNFTIPFNPVPNEKATAMKNKNANNALPKGPIGVAVNGVIFYNPYDAGTEEAVNMMDRCCGHPDPGSFYHYHKYPVCARSPFEDPGNLHSPLIGWAFDGFPVYGPYEGNGEMAMNSKTNPLNEFNIHTDAERGWHYHVTPGKFPYIIGGYWGAVNQSNLLLGRGPNGGPGGPGGRGGPGGGRPPGGPGGGPPPPPPPRQ